MSETYYLVCHEHKELIWIGRGSTFNEFYLRNDGIMEKFLWRHKGCNLKFEKSLDEIEKISYGEKGKLSRVSAYCEFTEPEQIEKFGLWIRKGTREIKFKETKHCPQNESQDIKSIRERILKTSNIYKIQWDKNNLYVFFNNGGVYQYKDIPEELSIGMSEAASPGSFLNREIKGNYRFERIT